MYSYCTCKFIQHEERIQILQLSPVKQISTKLTPDKKLQNEQEPHNKMEITQTNIFIPSQKTDCQIKSFSESKTGKNHQILYNTQISTTLKGKNPYIEMDRQVKGNWEEDVINNKKWFLKSKLNNP